MKVLYMNDERVNMVVKVQGIAFNAALNAGNPLDPFMHILWPTECRVFDLDMPANSSVYIKKWPNMVMISYIDDSALLNLENAQQGGEIMGA
jgi:hypothetical protein